MEYFPRENPGEGYGVGIFPILEVLGQANPNDITFPSSYAIEVELASALRAALPTSTVLTANYETVWAAENCPDSNGTLRCRWPAPGKKLSDKKKANTNSGNSLTSQGNIIS